MRAAHAAGPIARRPTRMLGGVIAIAVALAAFWGSGSPVVAGQSEHGVGVLTETFVDDSRPTPRSGDFPEKPERTLLTTIFYPTVGVGGAAVPAAEPDVEGGPYPLIIFSHGFSAVPADYESLLTQLAAAGNVVAAPQFPLSSRGGEAPPDAGDVVNQPGDVSFLYDELVARSRGDDGPLAGMIKPKAFGVAGHSNGGITTMGLISHTCCRDERIKAAAVLAGTPSPYPDGEYDYDDMPPFVAIHGTDDALVLYDDMARAFNKASTPKVFLTIEGGDHGAPASVDGPSGASVLATLTDFFAGYLEGDSAAIEHLPDDAEPGVTEIVDATKKGSRKKVPVEPAPELDRKVEVMPKRGLEGGQLVTVRWEDFSPEGTINIVQCSPDRSEGTAGCDLSKGQILQPDPTGEGELQIEVVEGPVGKAICGADHPPCVILVNDDGSQHPDATVLVKIRFAEE